MGITSLGEINYQLRQIDREINELIRMLEKIKLAGVKDEQQVKNMANDAITKTNFILENARSLNLREEDLKNIILQYTKLVNRIDGYSTDMGEKIADAKAELRGKVADKRDELESILNESKQKALGIDIDKLVDAHKKEADSLEKAITNGRTISSGIKELRMLAPVKIKEFAKAFSVVQQIEEQYRSEEGGIVGKKQRLEEAATPILERLGKTVEQILATEKERAELKEERENQDKFSEGRTFLYDALLKGGKKARQTFIMETVRKSLEINKRGIDRRYIPDLEKIVGIDIAGESDGEIEGEQEFDWEKAKVNGIDIWDSPEYKREIDILLEKLGPQISESEEKTLEEFKKVKADMRRYELVKRFMNVCMKRILKEASSNKLPQIFVERLQEVINAGPQELIRFLDNGRGGERATIEDEERTNLDKLAQIQEDIELLEIERNVQNEKKSGRKKEEKSDLSLTKTIRDAEKYLRFGKFSRREKVRHTFDYLVKKKIGGVIHIKEFFAAFKKENISKAREAYSTVNIEEPDDERIREANANFKRKRLIFFQSIVAEIPKDTARPIKATKEIEKTAYELTVEKE